MNMAGNVTFSSNGIRILELKENGDILVRDKLVENDKQVADALRDFVSSLQLNKVFPVTAVSHGEEMGIEKIFKTKEKADEFVKTNNNKPYYLRVEEHEVIE